MSVEQKGVWQEAGRKIIFNYNERVLNTAPHHIFSLSTVVLVCTLLLEARTVCEHELFRSLFYVVVVCLILHIIFCSRALPLALTCCSN